MESKFKIRNFCRMLVSDCKVKVWNGNKIVCVVTAYDLVHDLVIGEMLMDNFKWSKSKSGNYDICNIFCEKRRLKGEAIHPL